MPGHFELPKSSDNKQKKTSKQKRMNDVDSDVDMNGIEQPCGVRTIDAMSFE